MNKNISFNRRTITGALLLCVSIVLVISCHKHKEKVNPCAGASRTQASFKIEETVPYYISETFDYETDTICTGYARFTATCEADSFVWKIGAGTYHSKSQFINFGHSMDKVTIPVTLIVFRRPRTDCFADDKSSDTLTKTIYVAPSASKVFGKYKGSWESDPSDTFAIEVERNNLPLVCDLDFTNFDKTGCMGCGRAHATGYRKLLIYNLSYDVEHFHELSAYGVCSYACDRYDGTLAIGADGNSVTVSYPIDVAGGKGVIEARLFKGQRLP